MLKSTGFQVEKKFWDARAERVKKNFPNAAAINASITKFKNAVVERRNSYIAAGVEYTTQMLIEEKKAGDTQLNTLLQWMARERGLRFSTVENYETALKRWSEYTPVTDVKKIDVALLRGFLTFLKGRGCKDGSIKTFLLKVEGVVNFALEKNIITSSPFASFKFHRMLKVKNRHPALSKFQMDMMLAYMEDMFCVSGAAWDKVVRKLNKKISKESVTALFSFSYLSGGLAPIDCLLLKPGDINEKIINGRSYYVANLKRSKTGQPVDILIKITPGSAALLTALKSRGGRRLFSILEDVDDNNYEAITKHKRYLAGQGQAVLRGILSDVNERILMHNRGAAIPEALIDVKDISFYSARHTMASVLANSNVSLNAIASVLGRSIDDIGRYVKSLNTETELAQALEHIYGRE